VPDTDWGVVKSVVDRLSEEDRTRLASSFGVAESELDELLAGTARAALQEYLDMFLGRRNPPRISDARELRLLLLVLHVFSSGMPATNVVGDLFQLTPAQARTLVRNTRTKFRFELHDRLREAVTAFIDAGEKRGNDTVVEIRDGSLLEYAKELVLRGAGNPPPIEPGDETHRYVLKPATYRVLRAAVGSEPMEPRPSRRGRKR
jgi:hypothetical protein